MSFHIEQVTKPVVVGKGAYWDEQRQCLYYVSIFDHTIHKYDPSTGNETKTHLPGNVPFIAPLKDSEEKFVVGVDRRVLVIKWDGENESKVDILHEIAEVDNEPGVDTNRLNYGRADPKGRLFVGTMGKEDPPGKFQMGNGSLFMFDKNGAHKCEDNIHISNGMCWDTKNNIMYFIDTLEYAVRAYNYDFDTGNISNKRIIMDFKENNVEGAPDGMTIDTDGNLWITCFDGSQVIKVDPVTGKVLQSIPIPALQVTSVAFGGKNLDELYVTSASMNIRGEQKPPCGAVFKVTGLGVKGYAGDPFLF